MEETQKSFEILLKKILKNENQIDIDKSNLIEEEFIKLSKQILIIHAKTISNQCTDQIEGKFKDACQIILDLCEKSITNNSLPIVIIDMLIKIANSIKKETNPS